MGVLAPPLESDKLLTTLRNRIWHRDAMRFPKKVKSLSRVWLFATPWTVAHQALPSMGFSRQEYWSGLPFPSPGDHPNPGIEPRSPTLEADALISEPPGKPKLCHKRPRSLRLVCWHILLRALSHHVRIWLPWVCHAEYHQANKILGSLFCSNR